MLERQERFNEHVARGSTWCGSGASRSFRSHASPALTLLSGCLFFFSSRRRHTRWPRDWSSDVCSSDLESACGYGQRRHPAETTAVGAVSHCLPTGFQIGKASWTVRAKVSGGAPSI